MALVETEDFFGDESPLHRAAQMGGPNYEPRPQQARMAREVAMVLDRGGILCAEAPTGIGKTYAYLVPAYWHAVRTGKPVIISTHTINLQEQITRRDVPMLSRLLGKNINCHIAKGRANYLCRKCMREMMMDDGATLGFDSVGKVAQWAENTSTGDRSELKIVSSELRDIWSRICCSRENCTGSHCKFRANCYLFQARRQLTDAHIIVANHAYLFSALSRDGDSAMLPEYSAIIIDEAHTIPEISSAQMGRHASLGQLNSIFTALLREGRPEGMLGDNSAKELIAQLSSLRTAMLSYQSQMAAYIQGQNTISGILRVTTPTPENDRICEAIRDMTKRLNSAAFRYADETPEKTEYLQNQAEYLNELADDFQAFFHQYDDEWAYWLENSGRNREDVYFCREPVDASEMLEEMLFSNSAEVPVVVTSATLAINGSMDYFHSRIGAKDANDLILDSPFNYETQVTLHLPPMPSPNDAGYDERLLAMLKHYLPLTGGRAFVLFTSHAQLKRTANQMLTFLLSNDYTPIIQDGSMTTGQMLETFRKTPGAVLFGTDTFWTGVDVPGEALSSVIITRLPFGQYGHPIQEVRNECYRARGLNTFSEYSLPEAILKFRQGCGRLIRSREDTGIIVVLDGRIHTTSYGKMFINALPACTIAEEYPDIDENYDMP